MRSSQNNDTNIVPNSLEDYQGSRFHVLSKHDVHGLHEPEGVHETKVSSTNKQVGLRPRQHSNVLNKDKNPSSKAHSHGKNSQQPKVLLTKPQKSNVDSEIPLKESAQQELKAAKAKVEQKIFRIMRRVQKDLFDKVANGLSFDILAMQAYQCSGTVNGESSGTATDITLECLEPDPPDVSYVPSKMDEDI